MSLSAPYICADCHNSLRLVFLRSHVRPHQHASAKRTYTRPSFAPKPVLNLKHIRENPGLYEQNCVDRKYAKQAKNGWRIHELSQQLARQQKEAVQARQRNNALGKEIAKGAGRGPAGGERDREGGIGSKSALLDEAKALKDVLAGVEEREKGLKEEMERLALELPNLSSMSTPVGSQPEVLGYVNGDTPPQPLRGEKSPAGKSHVEIGKALDLLDFEASATTSGWGWYFLKNEAAMLEQALIQYALSVAMKRGWQLMTPPSLVYAHIASACGFMPRDQNGETQIYQLAQGGESGASNQEQVAGKEDTGRDAKSHLVLTGTAEIPFAGSQANRTLRASELPLKVLGPSRCYRAEAGARGVDTKGLYRVHEFTKVEMFAWTAPSAGGEEESNRFGDGSEEQAQGEGAELGEGGQPPLSQPLEVFEEMLSIQTEILSSLGLHARVLEMPTHDLGASATRKVDIEVYFPSRVAIDEGYGEVTSASMCSDYQTRRLGTRLKEESTGNRDKLGWPETLNGTAMAIPRVLAALLENGWRESEGGVEVPQVLRKWMPGELAFIGRKRR